METIIETFVEQDTEQLIYDVEKLDEWKEIIEELNLDGQKSLLGSDDKSPIPFMYLKTQSKIILEILCPMRIEVEKYSKSPIPIEILGLIKLSEREGYFMKIEIWYDDVNPDPVCIGISEKEKGENRYYLLGRWGAEKLDWTNLYNNAKERLIRYYEEKLTAGIEELKAANPLSLAMKKLRGEWVYFNSIS